MNRYSVASWTAAAQIAMSVYLDMMNLFIRRLPIMPEILEAMDKARWPACRIAHWPKEGRTMKTLAVACTGAILLLGLADLAIWPGPVTGTVSAHQNSRASGPAPGGRRYRGYH